MVLLMYNYKLDWKLIESMKANLKDIMFQIEKDGLDKINLSREEANIYWITYNLGLEMTIEGKK